MCLFFLEQSNQSKSATIEMYAPSSYNDTVTGETLSSVSEKSETYSNEGSNNDYLVSKSDNPNVTPILKISMMMLKSKLLIG